MNIVKTINRKYSFVKLANKFRDSISLFSNRQNTLFLSSFDNPFKTYSIITDELRIGVHQFKIITYDDLNNESEPVTGTVTISAYTYPPRFTSISYLDRHHVRLSWSHSSQGSPDSYVVYSNMGSGDVVKTQTFDAISGSLTSVDYNLETNGDWKFTVEAIKDGAESVSKFVVKTTIPQEDLVPFTVIDPELKTSAAIYAENVSVGKLRVVFIWPYGATVTHFRIYHDSGTGTVNYGSYIEFAKLPSLYQDFTTDQIYFQKDNKEFKYAIRAVTQYGIEDGTEIENVVILDGVAPASGTIVNFRSVQ